MGVIMSGLKITIPMAFTDTSLPILRDDPVLPSSGALMLIDMSHPASPVSGVPADQALLPNLAGPQAAALLGVSSSSVQPKMYKPAAFTGAAGKIERTGLGGLHGISPVGGNAIASSGPGIGIPPAVVAWVLAHPTHDYFMSTIIRMTRDTPATGVGQTIYLCAQGQQTNSYLAGLTAKPAPSFDSRPVAGFGPTVGSDLRVPAYTKAAPVLFTARARGWTTNNAGVYSQALPGDGTAPGVTGTLAGGGVLFGPTIAFDGIGSAGQTGTATFNAAYTATNGNKDKAPSFIFYRLYLEDLTVSGRSYATVDGLANTNFANLFNTAGGRYYGTDTFTDPATIP